MESKTHTFLEKLGLTEYEAKTLNTLFSLKEAQAPQISRLAQVPKTRVYDVLEKLVQKNLIIEMSGRPKLYRAIEAQKAIDLLIIDKRNQFKELEKESFIVKENLIDSELNEETGEKVLRVKDKQDFERILGQELLKANKSIQGLTEITDENKIICDALLQAKEKEIDIQLINSNSSKKLRNVGEVKQLNHGLNAFIIDGKKVVMAISDFKKERSDYHFTIMNEQTPMTNAVNHLFKHNWVKGKK